MKKLIFAILATLYLGSSFGATIHLHYCMGKLVEWGLWHNSKMKDKCSNCGMKNFTNEKGCCKDEQKQIKLEKDQKIVENFILFAQSCGTALTPGFTYLEVLIPSVTEKYPTNNAPPRSWKQSLFLLNCVFRI